MKVVNVIYSNPKKKYVHTKVIQYVDNAPFSHTCLQYIDSRTGQIMIYEASHGRNHAMLFNRWIKDNVIIKEQQTLVYEAQFNAMISLMNKYSFIKYGFLSLLGIFISKIFKVKRNLFAQGEQDFICSEVVAYFIRDILRFPLDKDIELMTPNDCSKHIDRYNQLLFLHK